MEKAEVLVRCKQGELGVESGRRDPDIVLAHVSSTFTGRRVSTRDSDIGLHKLWAVNGYYDEVVESVLQGIPFCQTPTLPVRDDPKLSLRDDGDDLPVQSGRQAKR